MGNGTVRASSVPAGTDSSSRDKKVLGWGQKLIVRGGVHLRYAKSPNISFSACSVKEYARLSTFVIFPVRQAQH